jgi:hypothetical protein
MRWELENSTLGAAGVRIRIGGTRVKKNFIEDGYFRIYRTIFARGQLYPSATSNRVPIVPVHKSHPNLHPPTTPIYFIKNILNNIYDILSVINIVPPHSGMSPHCRLHGHFPIPNPLSDSTID